MAGLLSKERPRTTPRQVEAERVVQEVETHVRTWLSYVEDKLSETLPGDPPLVIWLIEHVSSILNRNKMGANGKTPHARNRGKDSKTKHVPLGEKILWMVSKDERRKLLKMSAMFHYGTFVGINDNSGDYMLLTPDGLKKCWTIRRLLERDRWDSISVKKCKGTPWDPAGKEEVKDMPNDVLMPEPDVKDQDAPIEGARFKG
jgi:hypothetical protein